MDGNEPEARTLEEVDGVTWPEPPADATRLVKTVHELRRKPIGTLDAEDLRILLGQREGVDAIMARALDLLERDPLVAGDLYPGDLLAAVLRVPESYWTAHVDAAVRLRSVKQHLAIDDLP